MNFGNSVICEKDDAERPHYTIKAGGEAKEPWFAALEGYTSAALVENKVRNVPRYNLNRVFIPLLKVFFLIG